MGLVNNHKRLYDPLSAVSPHADPNSSSFDDTLANLSPEIRMLRALLHRTIEDIISLATMISPKDRRDARRWLFSNSILSDKSKKFTFIQVCEFLELNPTFVRTKVLEAEKAIQEYVFHPDCIAQTINNHKLLRNKLRSTPLPPLLQSKVSNTPSPEE